MNICPKCGKLGKGSFCPDCGTKMLTPDELAKSNTPSGNTCPKCGYKGESMYCPECGTKMESAIPPSEKDVPIGDTFTKEDDTPLSIDNKSQSKDDESRPADNEPKAACTDPLPTDHASQSMEGAQPKGTPAPTPEATTPPVIPAAPTTNGATTRKTGKILKIVGVIIGVIVLAIIAIFVIGSLSKDSLDHDMDSTKDATIHSLDYKYPDKWQSFEEDAAAITEGTKEHADYMRLNSKDDSFIGRMYVCYLGDDLGSITPPDILSYLQDERESRVLTVGDTDVNIAEYDIQVGNSNDDTVNYDMVSYTATFVKDYSNFLVVIDTVRDYYDPDFCDEFIQQMDIAHYSNPRKAQRLLVSYDGDMSPGTVINKSSSDNNDVTVTVEYDNGDKDTAYEWSLDKEITIEEGKTSEATVSCHGLTAPLRLTGRKPVSLKASYSGSTKKGTTVSKDDITVTVKYDNGESEEVTDWNYNTPVKLKAGKTSKIKIKYKGLTYTLKIKCTSLSKGQYKAKCKHRNYKNQLRKASYGKYIKIYGQVLQDCGAGYYRISSSGGYDNVYYVYAPSSRLVEDDWCTVYGKTAGIYEYETVMGASKKIPQIDAKYVSRD